MPVAPEFERLRPQSKTLPLITKEGVGEMAQ